VGEEADDRGDVAIDVAFKAARDEVGNLVDRVLPEWGNSMGDPIRRGLPD